MDPNANLQEQNELLWTKASGGCDRRRELREALQDWLTLGGFPPDWTRYPEAARAFRSWQRKRRKFQDLYR